MRADRIAKINRDGSAGPGASALSGIDPGLLDESDPPQESKLMEKTAG